MKTSIKSRSRRMSFKAESEEDRKKLLNLVYSLAGKTPPETKEKYYNKTSDKK